MKGRLGAFFFLAGAFFFLNGFGYQTNHWVNVRQGPSTETEKLGMLQKGEEICVLQTQEDWAKIIFEGREGYVSMTYLDELEYEVPLKLHYKEPLKINVLGDSITFGNLLDTQADAYPQQLGELCGALVRNYGECATTIAINNENSFIERYARMDMDANLILVMGGTNDFGLATPLGSAEEMMPGCFYGGLNDLLSGLKARYPGVPIVFLTPMQREKQEFPNLLGYVLEDYVNVIQDVCAQHGVYVLNLYAQESLNFRDEMPLYMPDGLHPNKEGQRLLAEYIYESLFVEEEAETEEDESKEEADMEEADSGEGTGIEEEAETEE